MFGPAGWTRGSGQGRGWAGAARCYRSPVSRSPGVPEPGVAELWERRCRPGCSEGSGDGAGMGAAEQDPSRAWPGDGGAGKAPGWVGRAAVLPGKAPSSAAVPGMLRDTGGNGNGNGKALAVGEHKLPQGAELFNLSASSAVVFMGFVASWMLLLMSEACSGC